MSHKQERAMAIIFIVIILAMVIIMAAIYVALASADSKGSYQLNKRYVDMSEGPVYSRVMSFIHEDFLGSDDIFMNFDTGSDADDESDDDIRFIEAEGKYGMLYRPARDEIYDFPHVNKDEPGNKDDKWLSTTKPRTLDNFDYKELAAQRITGFSSLSKAQKDSAYNAMITKLTNAYGALGNNIYWENMSSLSRPEVNSDYLVVTGYSEDNRVLYRHSDVPVYRYLTNVGEHRRPTEIHPDRISRIIPDPNADGHYNLKTGVPKAAYQAFASGDFTGKHEINNAVMLDFDPVISFGDTDGGRDRADGVPDFEAFMPDADGDGVPDSRWMWAPQMQIGKVRYVWAVKIVDLSSMINISVSTPMSQVGGNLYNSLVPTYQTPQYNDVARLLSLHASYTGSTASNLYTKIYGGGASIGTITNDFLDQQWATALTHRSTYRSFTAPFDTTAESFLRYRGGLSDHLSTHELKTTLFDNDMLGSTSDPREVDFRDALVRIHSGYSTRAQVINAMSSPSPASSMQPLIDYFDYQRNVMNLFTTYSGAQNYAVPLPVAEQMFDTDNDDMRHPLATIVDIDGVSRADSDALAYMAFHGVRERGHDYDGNSSITATALSGDEKTDLVDYNKDRDWRDDGIAMDETVAEVDFTGDGDITDSVITERNYAPNTPKQYKLDVTQEFTDGQVVSLYKELSQVYQLNDFEPPDWFTRSATSTRIRNEWAWQMALAIRDYVDTDNKVSLVRYGDESDEEDRTHLVGMEALPFITEVVISKPYVASTTTTHEVDDGTGTMIPNGEYDVDLQDNNDPVGIAIELRNPYSRPLDLSEISIYYQANGDADPIELIDLSTLVGVTEIPADGHLVLHNDAKGFNTGTANAFITMLNNADTTITGDIVNINADLAPVVTRIANSTTVTLSLRVNMYDLEIHEESDASRGDDVAAADTWAYQKMTIRVDGDNFSGNYSLTNEEFPVDPNGSHIYKQKVIIGAAAGVGMMAVQDVDATNTNGYDRFKTFYVNTEEIYADNTTIHNKFHSVGQDTKATIARERLNGTQSFAVGIGNLFDPEKTQIIIGNRGRITHLGELAAISFIGPVNKQTIQDVFYHAQSTDLREAYLDFVGYANMSNTNLKTLMADVDESTDLQLAVPKDDTVYPEYYKVPHATLLMSRLTTYALADTDLDGENDAFIPGRVNINTATPEVIKALMPNYLSDAQAQAVTDEIVRFRNNPGAFVDPFEETANLERSYPWVRRSGKGIAYMSELIPLLQHTLTDQVLSNDNNDNYMLPALASAVPSGNSLSAERVETADTNLDGRNDDIVEKTMLFKHLNERFTVRSDTYVAYVLIRGYEVDPDGRTLTNCVEEKRVMYMIDRSSVRNFKTPAIKLFNREIHHED